MRVYVFGSLKPHPAFSKLKQKDAVIEFIPIAGLKKNISSIPAGSIVYADLSACKPAEVPKIIKLLEGQKHILWGIIDGKNSIKDPADLFHRGAADYVGKEAIKRPISPARLNRVASFRSIEVAEETVAATISNCVPSGKDWSGVRDGKEYTFCLVYFELDNQADLKKNASDRQVKERSQVVHDFLERSMAQLGGKVWIWAGFGGVVLIPFDGEHCDAVLTAVRMQINRTIISIEECRLGLRVSYRLVLHLGNTVYRTRGETGTIISDSINSLYHLGQKFAKPGDLLLTEEMERFIPSGIQDLFVNAGVYEGRCIFRFIL
jgi:hypothetical protein